jgi:hypothetical protein
MPVMGEMPLSGQDVSQQHRLVETPLPEPFPVERHRHDAVGAALLCKCRQMTGSKERQGAAMLDLPAIL